VNHLCKEVITLLPLLFYAKEEQVFLSLLDTFGTAPTRKQCVFLSFFNKNHRSMPIALLTIAEEASIFINYRRKAEDHR
jgi:hypothetical protein